MYLELFHDYFPDVAERETRFLHIEGDPDTEGGSTIPAGKYALIEAYCTDPNCDCERVMVNVVDKTRGIVATISYGFNPEKTRAFVNGPNPFLDPLNRQSDYAEELLELFEEVALDEEYKERLQRHYRMVKEAVRSGASNAHAPSRTIGWFPTGDRRRQADRAKRLRKQQKAARRKNRRR
jgi:hypothetical protein